MEEKKTETPTTQWLGRRKKNDDESVSRCCPIARNLAMYNIEHMGKRTIMCAWYEQCNCDTNAHKKGDDPECTEEGTRHAMKKGELFYRFLGRKRKAM